MKCLQKCATKHENSNNNNFSDHVLTPLFVHYKWFQFEKKKIRKFNAITVVPIACL